MFALKRARLIQVCMIIIYSELPKNPSNLKWAAWLLSISPRLTVNILLEGVLPTVHLDELYAPQDLIHQSHAPVGHQHAFLAKIRRQSGRQHLIGRGEVMTREVSGSGRKWKQARSHYRSFRPVWGDQSDKCLSHQHQGLRLSGPSLHQMQFVNNSCRVDTRWMARVLCVKKCWSHVSKGQDNVKILAWTGSYLLLIINKWWNFQEVL